MKQVKNYLYDHIFITYAKFNCDDLDYDFFLKNEILVYAVE